MKTRSTLLTKRRNGNYVDSCPIYGCRKGPENKNYLIDEYPARAVIRILQEETYTGVLLRGRQETHNHKLKNIIHKPAEEWVCVEDAHEPIIQKRDFDLVQKISSLDTRISPDGEAVYLFSNLLVCGCGGGRMTPKTNTVKGKKYYL